MSTHDTDRTAALGLALLDALGLSGQAVSSITLRFHGGAVPQVDVAMWSHSLDEGGKFVEQLRAFRLVPVEAKAA